jgi:hypothetical protein
MLRPQYPNTTAPARIASHVATVTAIDHNPTSTACSCSHHPAPATPARPSVQLTPGALALLVGGGTTAVLVLGTVLVSLLLAVAVTAASLAVCAVVLRSLLKDQHKR